MLVQPEKYSRAEQDNIFNALLQNNSTTEEIQDPHCANKVSGGCRPIQIISPELLAGDETGPAENRKIALALSKQDGMSEFVIEEDAWDCILEQTIQHRKEKLAEATSQKQVVHFSPEMLEGMLHELDRLIDKYSSDTWNSEIIANDLVSILSGHRASIQEELINATAEGSSHLLDTDFLGPAERDKRRPVLPGIKYGHGINPNTAIQIQDLKKQQSESNRRYLETLHNLLMENRISSHQKDTVYNDLRRKRKRRSRRNKWRE